MRVILTASYSLLTRSELRLLSSIFVLVQFELTFFLRTQCWMFFSPFFISAEDRLGLQLGEASGVSFK